MRIKDFGKFIFTLTLFAFVLFITLSSFNHKAIIRMIPLVISIPTLLFLLIIIILDMLKKPEKIAKEKEISNMASLRIFGWIVLYGLVTFIFGFLICTPIFLLFFLHFEGQLTIKKAIINALISSIIIIGFFNYILKVELWPGIINEFLPKYIGGGILS